MCRATLLHPKQDCWIHLSKYHFSKPNTSFLSFAFRVWSIYRIDSLFWLYYYPFLLLNVTLKWRGRLPSCMQQILSSSTSSASTFTALSSPKASSLSYLSVRPIIASSIWYSYISSFSLSIFLFNNPSSCFKCHLLQLTQMYIAFSVLFILYFCFISCQIWSLDGRNCPSRISFSLVSSNASLLFQDCLVVFSLECCGVRLTAIKNLHLPLIV